MRIADSVTIVDPDAGDVGVPYVADSATLTATRPPGLPEAVDLTRLVTLDRVAGTLSFDQSQFEFLAAGQSALYTVAFDVQSGPDVVRRTMALTITGENDAPVITGGRITDSGETATQLAIVGELTFSDADLADTHTVTATPTAAGMLGTISAVQRAAPTPGAAAPDVIDFGYVVDTARTAPLAQGESRTESFDIAVTDGRGGIATRNVSFSLVGENDAPTLGPATAGVVAERADGAPDENTGSLGATGTIAFDDIDLTDTHTVAATLVSASGPTGATTARGALAPQVTTAAAGAGAGEVTWDYSVAAADLDGLGEGETVAQVYRVTVTDRFGASAFRDVTITLTGAGDANNAPTGAVTVGGAPTEDQILTASNTLADADGLDPSSISYRWQRSRDDGASFVDIAGATAGTYALGDDDVGARVRAVASYTDGRSGLESVASAATGPVINVNDAPTGAVVVAGTATEDQVLTASNTLADADGLGDISYRWQRSVDGGPFATIEGAAGPTYRLGDADVGASVRAVAAFTDRRGTPETVASAATAPVADRPGENRNGAPSATPDVLPSATEDTPFAITAAALLVNDTDPEGDTLAIVSVGGASGGTVALDPGGTIVFTPSLNASGPASFTYTVGDGRGGEATSTARFTVDPVNDAPTVLGLRNPFRSTDQDTPIAFSVLAGDPDADIRVADVEGDDVRVTLVEQPSQGRASVAADGRSIGFDPGGDFDDLAAGEQEAVTLAYQIADFRGGVTSATVDFTVTGVNDAPVVAGDAVTLDEEVVHSIAVLGNDRDPEGDALTITQAVVVDEAGNVIEGLSDQVSISGDRIFFDDRDAFQILGEGESETVRVRYTVSDGQGRESSAVATFTILGVRDFEVTGTAGANTLVGDGSQNLIRGLAGDDVLFGLRDDDTLDGGAGTDRVSYRRDAERGGTAAVIVNLSDATIDGLAPRTARDGFGDTDTLVSIEDAVGTAQADVFHGSTGDNAFTGLGGADRLIGSAGTDRAVYTRDDEFGGTQGILANLSTTSQTLDGVVVAPSTVRDAFGAVDQLSGIEEVTSTRFDDIIQGGGGNEFLDGNAGDDDLKGGDGADALQGGPGNDVLDGGRGLDEAMYGDYDGSGPGGAQGVTVSLAGLDTASSITISDPFGGADTLIGIERLRGTRYADTLTGNSQDNRFRGLAGDDFLTAAPASIAWITGATTSTRTGSVGWA